MRGVAGRDRAQRVPRAALRRPQQVSLDLLRQGGQLVEPTVDVDPVELIAAGELAVRVRAAIAALPVGQRQAVALFYIDGLTQAEAAEELRTRHCRSVPASGDGLVRTDQTESGKRDSKTPDLASNGAEATTAPSARRGRR